jgi:hypothetical protein
MGRDLVSVIGICVIYAIYAICVSVIGLGTIGLGVVCFSPIICTVGIVDGVGTGHRLDAGAKLGIGIGDARTTGDVASTTGDSTLGAGIKLG